MQNDGGMPRGFCALCYAPNWLAAESVHASRAAPRSASGKQSRCHRQSPTKAAHEAGCEQPGFYRADTWASNGHACPNSGAVWRIRNSECAADRSDKVTRQDGELPLRQKRKRKWGILPPRSAKLATQQSGDRRSNDSVWKVKCLKKSDRYERLSAQRRVEQQCESHSSQ